ncbi:DNA alkylation repair enzyme [Methanobrevibacter curvatus]|uniref:DNA alkylation repair enzyme n=1 Tax=Methanobrevibacter curvatus TaxID=49547 RepID=A0A162FGX1_9EURY|nr:DNA alkylation repair enzyme [Methanobrevibacter curvatus]
MEVGEIIKKVEYLADSDHIETMKRLGINCKNTYGLRVPVIKEIAKECGKDHELALNLWKINTRETKILASLVDNSKEVSSKQMDEWTDEFDD